MLAGGLGSVRIQGSISFWRKSLGDREIWPESYIPRSITLQDPQPSLDWAGLSAITCFRYGGSMLSKTLQSSSRDH